MPIRGRQNTMGIWYLDIFLGIAFITNLGFILLLLAHLYCNRTSLPHFQVIICCFPFAYS